MLLSLSFSYQIGRECTCYVGSLQREFLNQDASRSNKRMESLRLPREERLWRLPESYFPADWKKDPTSKSKEGRFAVVLF